MFHYGSVVEQDGRRWYGVFEAASDFPDRLGAFPSSGYQTILKRTRRITPDTATYTAASKIAETKY
jgi:hypothetical protein